MKPQPQLATMIKGQVFDGYLLVRASAQRTSSNGGKYLDMTLCDLSGEDLMYAAWPAYDEAALVRKTVEVALQINGKVRGRMDVPADLTRDSAQDYFMQTEVIQKLIAGKTVRKFVFVPGRLVNIVVG